MNLHGYITRWLTVFSFTLLFSLASQNTSCELSHGIDTLNWYQKLAHDIFEELVEINTTSRYGSTRAAEAMAARLRYYGYPASDIKVIGPDPLHKNLVARYHGKGKLRPILFICHLDVVEAYPEDWTVDPFTFLEKDGYYYGRGTTDVKCECADLIVNLIRLKREGYVPNRDIIVALTADEEGGNANGVNWLLENQKNLIDAEFCINPDGGGGEMKNGKHTLLGIQTGEKVYVTYKLEAKNKGGHSSIPTKDNAIYSVAEALTRLADYDFPVRLNETTRSIFKRSAAMESGQLKSDMLAVIQDSADITSLDRLAAASPYYNALMRTTCVATKMSAGHAENALPQSATAIVNCRLLPDDNPENVLSCLQSIIADTAVSVTCEYASFLAPLSPLRNDIVETVEHVTASMWPGVIVLPVMSTGATDGKYLRRAGVPVYGVSGIFGEFDDFRAHGRDERIGIKEFYDGVEFMYQLIKALSSETNAE
jgi:acetylornithine deacetylase/succinyl-diaminopimelate desuccinylase-like protein